MARHKSKKRKEHLVHERKVNKRAPVWVYQKTKNRGLIRERKRNWRYNKIGPKLKIRADRHGE